MSHSLSLLSKSSNVSKPKMLFEKDTQPRWMEEMGKKPRGDGQMDFKHIRAYSFPNWAADAAGALIFYTGGNHGERAIEGMGDEVWTDQI
jgi:hypothetical protein